MAENHDDLWVVHTAVNEWVRFADTKAGAVLGAQGVIFALAIPSLVEHRAWILAEPLVCTLVIVAAACALLSVAWSLKCVIPRLRVGEAKSLIFFGHIAQAFDNPEAYHEMFERYRNDEKGISGHIAHQVWSNSVVAWKKYKDSTWALRFFAVGISCDAIIAFLAFIRG